MFREIKSRRPFEGILNQIIEKIQNGELCPGDALPAERMMAESMGVSRPAVREVLRALELLGVITSVRGGANYIAENLDNCMTGPLSILFSLNKSQVQHAQQLRAALEQEAAYLAAKNCTALDAAELTIYLEKLNSTESEKERANLDRDLHMKIARMAGNPMIYSVLKGASELTESIIIGIRSHVMQVRQSSQEVDEQHSRLIHAVIHKDPVLAEQVMKEHMNTIEKYILEL